MKNVLSGNLTQYITSNNKTLILLVFLFFSVGGYSQDNLSILNQRDTLKNSINSISRTYNVPKNDSLFAELIILLTELDSIKHSFYADNDTGVSKTITQNSKQGLGAKTKNGETIIKGKVTDGSSGEGLPYVNIYFPTTMKGVVTDFDGFYSIKSENPSDSLMAKIVSYRSKSKKVTKGQIQTINFQLFPTAFETKVVNVRPGENPAHRIIRKVHKLKEINDMRSLKAYQFNAYTKVELDADNIDKKFLNNPVMRPFKSIFDSLKLQAGDDGKPILPVFISETLSDVYFRRGPERKTEIIKANKTKGIGVNDAGFVSQLMGSTFQDYNFYDNYVNILEKNFVSPISADAIGFYKFTLADSSYEDGKFTYKIEFKPRRELDLAFTGTMWIQDSIFALKRISAEIGSKANLNYIERIKISQELEQTKAGNWLPNKLRILLDIGELTKNSTGFLAKLYASYKDITVNDVKPISFYDEKIKVDEESQGQNSDYWEKKRHEQLNQEDKAVYGLIDSVKNIPKVKTYVDIIDFLLNGHLKLGKNVEIGPYIFLYGNNVVEGQRFRVGFRTTYEFSKYWILKGYGAYGTRDNRFKGSFQVERFLSRKNWTKIGIQLKQDVEGLGLQDEFFSDNTLLTASAQLGLLNRMNRVKLMRFWGESDIAHGLNARIFFTNKIFQPVGKNFNFHYYPDPFVDTTNSRSKFNTTEISMEMRYSPKDVFITKGNKRVRLVLERAPVFTLNLALGLKGIMGSEFNYQKASLNIQQLMKLGWAGRGAYSVTATRLYAMNYLPYPLLDIQLGNETIVRSDNAFNLMNFFEFVGNRNVTAFYTHHFDGLLFNKVPLLKKLKWREVIGVKSAWVSVSDYQRQYYEKIQKIDGGNYPFQQAHLEKPYVEVSYGIENIFKILRIDAIHRLTYRNNSIDGKAVRTFFVKGSLYFAF